MAENRPRRGGKKRKASAGNARDMLGEFVAGNVDRLQRLLDEIEVRDGPKAAFQAITDTIEYSVPKLARQEHTGEDGGPVTLVVQWLGDSAPATPKPSKPKTKQRKGRHQTGPGESEP
tara:strand:- start:1169 stop:1522 length:354 start_codon:yes stop_codon:yes gene_type:complete